jgi:uncharacterized Zn finger protein
MSRYYGFPEYVSVGQKRAKAEKTLARLRKIDPNINPITLEGTKLVYTWWGKAWNKNLENYADYASRIGRGRSYLRHGAVLDLQIQPGLVTGLVQGSQTKPYSIEIKIAALKPKAWQAIKDACEGELASLQELLEGKFPKNLTELFTAQQTGLFPSPAEIKFDCSCPDWASMCKHVAAVLFGIGCRLDSEPALFFKLRKVDMNELITETVKQQSDKLLHKAKGKSSRIMADADLAGVFDLDISSDEVNGTEPAQDNRVKRSKGPSPVKQKKAVVEPAKKKVKPPVKKAGPKKADQQAVKKTVKQAKKPADKPVKKTVNNKKASKEVKKNAKKETGKNTRKKTR